MIPGGTVSFTYEWQCPIDWMNTDQGLALADQAGDTVDLEVEATITDFFSSTMADAGGPGTPSEGGDVEDLTVRLPNDDLLSPIPHDLLHDLERLAEEEHLRDVF